MLYSFSRLFPLRLVVHAIINLVLCIILRYMPSISAIFDLYLVINPFVLYIRMVMLFNKLSKE